MKPIRKHILTDAAHRPVAVQRSLEDWHRIEPLLREQGLLEPGSERDLDELLTATGGLWRRGDGLAYQRTLRAEWDHTSGSAGEDTE